MLAAAKKDSPSTTADWERIGPTIAGVALKRTRNLVTGNSLTTELFRADWSETGYAIEHVLHVAMDAGRISAWHCHTRQTDHIFVVAGRMLLALYDSRTDSPTHGQVMSLRLDARDPQMVRIPPLVFHGIKPLIGDAAFVNIITHPYNYADPDEWRLPANTDQIPFDITKAV